MSTVIAAAGAALMAATSTAAAAPAGPVRTVPASFTPWLLKSVPNQIVNQLVPCGNTMYAVGTISGIGQADHTYTRSNAFSFSATAGAVTSWAPTINGNVHTIALSPDCATAYLGGTFTSVNGVPASNLVAVNAVTGAVETGFAHSANNSVLTMKYTHGTLLIGGSFTSVNGASRTLLASLDPTTGAVTSYAKLSFLGSYPRTHRQVYNSDFSHSGDKILINGVFTSIAGQSRQQVAMLDLGPTSVTLDPWYATELNEACAARMSFYARAAAWSPDDSTVYVATTGYRPDTGPGSTSTEPRVGMCDAAIAFPATGGEVTKTWINYTGCDSLYAVAADANDVYIGGHERWADNPNGCDWGARGSVARPGIGSINPIAGKATPWNPTRSLGYGVQDLVLTGAGLWIASDNFKDGGSQMCGGVNKKGGICFMSY